MNREGMFDKHDTNKNDLAYRRGARHFFAICLILYELYDAHLYTAYTVPPFFPNNHYITS